MPIAAEQSTLFVTGSIVKERVEAAGKRTRKSTKTTDRSETFADEPVLDIYPASDVFGFRIRAGFDFSCLGTQMSRLAIENFGLLTDEFRLRLHSTKLIDVYSAASPLLRSSWPNDERNESSKVSRGTFGGVQTRSVIVSDNTVQFTKFSRLQRHFI